MKNLILSFLLLSFISAQTWALNPSRTYKQLPEKYNMEYKSDKVKTNDGEAILNVWYFPAKNKTTRLVLIAHNGEGNMADYLRRVDQFVQHNNVVIFDYRGFGESSDFEIDKNMYIYPHFQNDLETMIDYCRKTYTATFDLYGWGIGAGLSLGIGWNRPEVRRIIADTPFLSMEDLENRFSNWEEPMEVPFAGYDKKNEPINNTAENAAKTLEKVMLIVGSNDNLFKVADLKALQQKAPKIIQAPHIVENPDRKDNFMLDKVAYMTAVNRFLEAK